MALLEAISMAQWDNLEEGTCGVVVVGHRCRILPEAAAAAARMNSQPSHGKG